MYFDSGASRSVITPTSPIREYLTQSKPVQGSCSIGDGTPLEYIEKVMFNNTIDTTVVKNLRYDLFSSVSAAKKGLTSIIDYNMDTGENNSYMVDKQTGNSIPLIERGQGILEVPLQLMTPRVNVDDTATTSAEKILYAFDILNQLNEHERDFLIHARLVHAPKRTILKMKKMALRDSNSTQVNMASFANPAFRPSTGPRTTDMSASVTLKANRVNTFILI
jgi:hypothetical protein